MSTESAIGLAVFMSFFALAFLPLWIIVAAQWVYLLRLALNELRIQRRRML